MSAFFSTYTIDTSNDDITIDGLATTIGLGSYYMYSPSRDSGYSLVDMLAGYITAAATASVAASVSTTGILTLSGSQEWSYSNLSFYAALGLASEGSGSTVYTGSAPMRYCWFPTRTPSDSLAPLSRQGARENIANQSVADDGTTLTSQWGTILKQEVEFRMLTKNKTWISGSSVDNLEQFWVDVLSQGKQMVFAPTWSEGNATNYWVYYPVVTDGDKFIPKRENVFSDSYWKYRIKLIGA